MSRANPGGAGKGGLSREAKTLLGIGAALLIGAVAVIFLTGSGSSSSNSGSEQTAVGDGQSDAILVREDSPRIVAPGSEVTLVEFLDLECEACGAMYPVVKRVLAEYEGKINFVVRYFPLHQNSVLAATSAEAAGRQGKYWEMYAKLFEGQGTWGEKSQPQTEVFLGYARELGLDLARFQTDLQDPAIRAKVDRDRRDGIAAGVRGTPTFFLDGEQIGNVMTYDQLTRRLNEALQ